MSRSLPAYAVLLVALATACDAARATPETRVTIGTGSAGVYYPLAEALARRFTAAVPHVVASAVKTDGPVASVEALQRGALDLAFARSDIVYFAYVAGLRDPERPRVDMRGIAVLHGSALQIFTLADSSIRRVRDLRGKRVNIAPSGSGTESVARMVFDAHGLRADEFTWSQWPTVDAMRKLEAGEVDATVTTAIPPTPPLAELARRTPIRALSVEPAAVNHVRQRYGFFRPIVIPAGTYDGLDDNVRTIGVDNVLVCRVTLPESLVYELTRILFDSMPALAEAHTVLQGVHADHGSTTPIPLHPGAARYYREQALRQ